VGEKGDQGPVGSTGAQGPVGNFIAETVLTNTAFLNSLATNQSFVSAMVTNPAFVNAVANQIASNSSNFLLTTRAMQTLSFPAIPSQRFAPSKTVPLRATSSANLSPITFTCDNPSVGIFSNNVLMLLGTGTTTVRAYQAGNAAFNPVTATQLLIVK
jgi:hypothetical protein